MKIEKNKKYRVTRDIHQLDLCDKFSYIFGVGASMGNCLITFSKSKNEVAQTIVEMLEQDPNITLVEEGDIVEFKYIEDESDLSGNGEILITYAELYNHTTGKEVDLVEVSSRNFEEIS